MKENKPYYTLRKLMYKKYGAKKFALGCELVARWVQFETRAKEKCDADYILQLCNATAKTNLAIYPEQAEAIRRLFGLSSIEKLYTK